MEQESDTEVYISSNSLATVRASIWRGKASDQAGSYEPAVTASGRDLGLSKLGCGRRNGGETGWSINYQEEKMEGLA